MVFYELGNGGRVHYRNYPVKQSSLLGCHCLHPCHAPDHAVNGADHPARHPDHKINQPDHEMHKGDRKKNALDHQMHDPDAVEALRFTVWNPHFVV